MPADIAIKKIWSDDDMVEFEITTLDGCSQFCIKVYAVYSEFEALIADLDRFRKEVYDGIYDMELGEFGPEYANGAFHARLHFDPESHGKLSITVHAESDWRPFKKTQVASRASFYLKSEPALLDNFISELRRISSGGSDSATFECM
jgi:hypothetical protein